MKFACLCAAFLLVTTFQASQTATASDYPRSPIRIINASSAGGVSDVFVRSFVDELGERLKQPVVVENRPGGAFNIATRACAESEPDGYTFCVLPGEVFIFNPTLFKNLPFDPDKAADPVMVLFSMPQVLVVGASLGVKSVDELVAASKAKAGTMSYSSPGVAQAAFVESFVKKQKGGDIVKVPFKGGGDAVNGIMTGATPVAFIGVGNIKGHLDAKTMVGLAIDSEERLPLIPDVPSIREIGFTGDMVQPFYALFAPPGTPKPIVDLVRTEVAKIISRPDFKEKNVAARGLTLTAGTADELRGLIKKGRSVAPRVVAASGLTPQ